jgi:anti-sigma regulatory factor (Ser/Thr protein kinase)
MLATHWATDLDELASLIMDRHAPADGYFDDVALLLYRQPPPLNVTVAAHLTELAPTRDALRGWLSRAAIDPDQALDVLVAAGEAMTNAIEHGHRDRPGGAVALYAATLGDRLEVTVADSGTWKPPDPAGSSLRGRGIMLMRGLMDEVRIAPAAQGTTVRMHATIRRNADRSR